MYVASSLFWGCHTSSKQSEHCCPGCIWISCEIKYRPRDFAQVHALSRLVGSPPGYIGYDEGGQLTESVRRKPYSVVLFDEIEKAHPDVFNILLQILEDGKLTDAQGRRVDFRNVVVIMTSNIGSASISKNVSLGFSIGDEEGLSYEDMKGRVMSDLKKVFRPELLNRIDEIIVFPKLTRDEIIQIVDLLLQRVREQMTQHEVTIELTEEAKELLVERGYDPAMGARPLRRAIQRYIEDPLADFVLGRELMPGSTIVVARKNDEEVDIDVIPPTIPEDVQAVTVPPEEPRSEDEHDEHEPD
jgi:ATP-dependent Clp protease ATP-binding subunit ClpC